MFQLQILTVRRACAGAALGACGTLLLLCAQVAADTITSDNWSGYAAHGTPLSFARVSAGWREPSAICSPGTDTDSSFWVGIGGYSLSSSAMEQVGTELDCSDGSQSQSGWYELVPAPSRAVRMTIDAGDAMRATVSVSQKRVSLTLSDLTRGETFKRTVIDHSLDVSSAEWIAEAPSDCSGSSASSCTTSPLADFGAVRFTNARATTAGRTAGITSARWKTTKLLLGYTVRGTTFIAKTTTANATPTALTAGGHAFAVRYSSSQSTPTTTTTTTTALPSTTTTAPTPTPVAPNPGGGPGGGGGPAGGGSGGGPGSEAP